MRAHCGGAPAAIHAAIASSFWQHSSGLPCGIVPTTWPSFGFTIGQRRGLRLGTPAPDGRPRYVLDIEPVSGTVTVGPREALTVDEWEKEAATARSLRDELNAYVRLLHRRELNGWTLQQAIGLVVREGPDRWRGIDGENEGEILAVLRDPAGAVDRLDIASFIFSRDPHHLA